MNFCVAGGGSAAWIDAIKLWLADLKSTFILCFVEDNRFERYMLSGLKATFIITICALIIGLILGVIVALVRVTHDKNIATTRPGLGRVLLKFFNWLCQVYLTVFRGVPVVVQLLIWFFVILAWVKNAMITAVVAFGMNSGAYVAEIMRAGIMSVDGGQSEAGRSLGLNYVQTMRFIILPQAFKNVLPTLCNECIVLLKETSVAGYISVTELTKGAYIIVGRTYEAFMPLIASALIYLVIVMFLAWIFGKLERRLRASDQR